MPKSGSAYLYNLINELLTVTGLSDAREIKDKYNLENLMQWHNNNIGNLTLKKIVTLCLIALREKPFVVKTHSPPTGAAKLLKKIGLIKMIYCYRDPRDSLLSAIDHGEKIKANGENHTFARMTDFDAALKNVAQWIEVWQQYNSTPGTLMIRYEDLLANPIKILALIEEHLGIFVNSEVRELITWKYSKDNPQGERTGLHYNKAISFRYQREMPMAHQKKCLVAFKEHLKHMGYSHSIQ